MSTDSSTVFKKDNLDLYLKELAKEYKETLASAKKAADGSRSSAREKDAAKTARTSSH